MLKDAKQKEFIFEKNFLGLKEWEGATCLAWLKTLAETYDVYSHLAGVDKNEQAVLLPISTPRLTRRLR